MPSIVDQWKEILAHLKSLRDAREPKDHRPRREKHTVSRVVNAYAAHMHRRQHKGGS
jgi:hypothetical protein